MNIVAMTTTMRLVVISAACFTLRMRLCIYYMCDVYIVFLYVYVHFLQFMEVWK